MYYVYVLRSATTGKWYTGQTNNLERRLADHARGKTLYTRDRGPYELVYRETYSTRSEAIRRERYFKTGKGRQELDNLLGH